MKTFEEFKQAVYESLKSKYANFKEDTQEVIEFLHQEEGTLRDDYETAKKSGRIETHFDIEVSNSAWGLDLLF